MILLTVILLAIVSLNTAFSYYIVFSEEKRDVASTWAWLLLLTLLPGIGIIAYLFLGRKLLYLSLFNDDILEEIGLPKVVELQKELIKSEKLHVPETLLQRQPIKLISLLLESNQSPLTTNNSVSIIANGEDKFDQLIKDIDKARHHIHMIYFIFRMDEIGSKVLRALEQKAEQGVKVKLLYEPAGAKAMSKGFFDRLHELGGVAEPFLGPKFLPISLRTNYRMHRKLAIIDGGIGYTGGFNIGNDYLGLYEKMGYWRDTHLRIEGHAVRTLQSRFFMDWNAAVPDHMLEYADRYFPPSHSKGTSYVQIVSSGPDNESEAIKKGFIKMISMAKKSIYIQTPYFIPDDGLMEAMKIAIMSGTEVKVMIPNKPDHPLIYRATLSFIGELIDLGAEVLVYDKGFLHSKAVVVDDELLSIGTANFDIRSFRLNFEVTAFIYDQRLAEKQVELFKEDAEVSHVLTKEMIRGISRSEKMKRQISRLFSPIL
ncbi:cardiolipin synthase [Alkalibacterium pelagium]|uniref:Cardiolipin synthase n=2 Tax=Alkalibacterium pelagium TaxID=426702 RepID=A0A1H7JSI3_9LACT|nr:cardiolipin synthase [Alkalibacterium pelagium]GEN50556.1 cardiolipin synthase [Alkalibacterium pelagium]SEK77628.1 cardiolipin synthase [Alkalibacterium pelagium]